MSIKPDHWIRKMALEHGMIEPFVDKQTTKGAISYGVSAYGYDIRVSDEFKVFTDVFNTVVDPKNFDEKSFVTIVNKECIIPPNSFALATTIEYFKIPKDILEAATDMGATPFQIFREIIGPMSMPGVAIGMIFIFVMIMGEFATAVVVYGGKTSTAGTVILNYYGIANYPFAAVNALMLMLAMVIGIIVILRVVDIRKEL